VWIDTHAHGSSDSFAADPRSCTETCREWALKAVVLVSLCGSVCRVLRRFLLP